MTVQLNSIADIHYGWQHRERSQLSADQVCLAQAFDIAMKHLDIHRELPVFEAVLDSLIEQMNAHGDL